MTHGAGLDPHFFDWPTLVMYAVAPFQAWQAAPSYLAGRFVVVAIALGGIAAAWWLGSRAYGTVAGAIAAAATAVDVTHVTFSHAAVTDVPLTTLVTVALALLVTGRFELAGVAIGLATAAKYPGALHARAARRRPLGQVAEARGLGALAAVAFFAGIAVRRPRRGRARGARCGGSRRSTGAAGSASSTTTGRASRSSRTCGTGSARCW